METEVIEATEEKDGSAVATEATDLEEVVAIVEIVAKDDSVGRDASKANEEKEEKAKATREGTTMEASSPETPTDESPLFITTKPSQIT